MSNPAFNAPDYTADSAAQYKANIDASIAANGHEYINLGITYSSSVLSITDARGGALSSTNPAFVRFQDPDAPGLSKYISVEANQGFIDDSGSSEIIGNLFGATTGVAWGQDCPFFIYAVSNDAMDAVAFMISRVPHLVISPAVSEIGAPDDPVADNQYSFFSFDNIDETLYDTNPCVCIGSFRMRMSASDDWTVQALSVSDGIGRFHEGTWFTLPQGQVGAQASSYIVNNGGTEPTWTTENYTYRITKDGRCEVIMDFKDCNLAGVGTQDVEFVTPFKFTAALQSQTLGGIIAYEESGVGSFPLMPGAESTMTQSFRMWDAGGYITPTGGDRVENEDVDTNDDLYITLNYFVKSA